MNEAQSMSIVKHAIGKLEEHFYKLFVFGKFTSKFDDQYLSSIKSVLPNKNAANLVSSSLLLVYIPQVMYLELSKTLNNVFFSHDRKPPFCI